MLGDADDRVGIALALGRQGPGGTVGGEQGRGLVEVVAVAEEVLRELASGGRGRLPGGRGASCSYQEGPVADSDRGGFDVDPTGLGGPGARGVEAGGPTEGSLGRCGGGLVVL